MLKHKVEKLLFSLMCVAIIILNAACAKNLLDESANYDVYSIESCNSLKLDLTNEEQEADEIINKLNNSDGDFTFVFLTDLHYSAENSDHKNAYEKTTRIIKKITDESNISSVIFGGDNTENIKDIEKTKKLNSLLSQQMTSKISVPFISCKGNHDDNSISGYDEVTQKCSDDYYLGDENLNSLLNGNNTLFVSDSEDSMYYYADFEEAKIRMFVLNSIDIPYELDESGYLKYNGQWNYAYRNEQLNFVANNLYLDEDWSVIFISHMGFDESLWDIPVKNNNIMLNIINAYINGKAYEAIGGNGDFAYSVSSDYKHAGTVIGNLCGHMHQDLMALKDSINCVATRPALYNIEISSLKKVNYTSFDVYSINIEKREVNIYRYGVGKDRSFTY